MKVGAQLYTIRKTCTNLADFSESLKKIAEIGYRTVQVSGSCSFDPQWLKQQLDQNGLQCVITHTDRTRILEEPSVVAVEHDVLACRYVGLGSYSFNPEKGDSVEHFVQAYGAAAKTLKQHGKYFMYHNHAREFRRIDGSLILEQICEQIPAEDMGITLDTYWVQVGGGDPAQWLEKLAGRIPCIHLKDCAYQQVMAVLGEGNINFDRVFEKAEAGGTEYMLVEQDDCNGEDPFDCLKRSYQFLRAYGFE